MIFPMRKWETVLLKQQFVETGLLTTEACSGFLVTPDPPLHTTPPSSHTPAILYVKERNVDLCCTGISLDVFNCVYTDSNFVYVGNCL